MENLLNQITNYLMMQSWQIAILVTVITAVTWLLKNKSAHIRYLLWLIVLAKCLVPPLVTIPLAILPQENVIERVPILPAEPPAANIERVDTAITEHPIPISTPVVKEKAIRLTIHHWLGFGWIVGVAVFAVFAVIKALRTNLWLWRQRMPLAAKLQSGIEDLFSGLEIRILPKVWLIEGIGQPFVWGLLRGSIYLPADFVKVDNAEHRKGILGHEISHILRFDAAVNLLQIIAQAVFWFHPFVWWANKRIRAEREKCCDEMAIARLDAKAGDYSKAIVNILICESKSTRPVPSLAVAGPVKNIEERIKTMLRPGKKFYKRPSLIAVTVVLVLALLTVPTALVLTARAETKATSEQKPEPAKSLHQAAADGEIEQVKSLISKGADINAKDKLGKTALHYASEKGYTEVVKLLLAEGADIQAKEGRWGRTALHLAAWWARKDVVEVLLAGGADIDARNDRWESTPLHDATIPGDTNLIALLLAKGADLKAQDIFGKTALHNAVEFHHPELVKFLLAKGTDVNERSGKGYDFAPLHIAVNKGYRDMVKLLVANGADMRAMCHGWTPVDYAMMSGQEEMVEFLVSMNAEMSPFHVAAYLGKTAEVEVHLKETADVDISDASKFTPLHCAVCGGQVKIIELLLSKGANVNAKNAADWTPLHHASNNGRKNLVELLLAHGADVNLRDRVGRTALFLAAYNGHRDIVEILYAKGASISLKHVDNWTPLHVASRNGHKDVVEFLLDKGADVNSKNSKGQTALILARQENRTEIVELLRKHGAKE